jgi:hypothetical protein
MPSIRSVDLPGTIDTSRHDLTREFFTPLLSLATRYDRGVGFFSSGWLRINAVGMAAFSAIQGRARWITSPILSAEDWRAMLDGSRARRNELLRQSLERDDDEP